MNTHQRRLGIAGWLLLAPLVLWVLAFVVAPTAIMLVYSFCQLDELGDVQYTFTWENYARLFSPEYLPLFARAAAWGVSAGFAAGAFAWLGFFGRADLDQRARLPRARRRFVAGFLFAAAVSLHGGILTPHFTGTYLKVLWRSVEYAGLTTLICLAAGYPVAYLIGRAAPARRRLLLVAVMIPFWTSFLIRTYAWLTILKQEGVLNGVLRWLGLIPHVFPRPLDLLYTPTAVVIGLVYAYLPFMILPIYASVEKLDGALLEAAMDLGANPWRAFRNVVLPLTRPGIGAGVLLVFVPAIGMFAVTSLLGGAKVPMVGDVIQNQFGQARDWPFGAALGMTLLLILGLAFALVSGRADTVRGRATA